jgi:hypothetical protein
MSEEEQAEQPAAQAVADTDDTAEIESGMMRAALAVQETDETTDDGAAAAIAPEDDAVDANEVTAAENGRLKRHMNLVFIGHVGLILYDDFSDKERCWKIDNVRTHSVSSKCPTLTIQISYWKAR